MKIKKVNRRPKIMVEGERAGKVVSWLKKYNIELTAAVAFLALIIGILTIFIAPWLQWIRLILSFVTFLAAVMATGRIVTAGSSMSGSATLTPNGTVVKTGSEDEK